MVGHNKATVNSYAVQSDRIFIKSEGGRKIFSSDHNLTDILDELSGRFGQLWTVKPSDSIVQVGDLFYSVASGLEVCTSAADPALLTPAVWTKVVPSSMTANIFTGTRTSTGAVPDSWDVSAQKIAAAQYADPAVNPKPSVGDLIIVTDTAVTPSVTETFIISALAVSVDPAYTDFSVEWVTTKKAEEIDYDDSDSSLGASNVQAALDTLALGVRRAVYGTTLTAPTIGTPISFMHGTKIPNVGLKLVTCTITIEGVDSANDNKSYVTTGIRQFVVNNDLVYNNTPDTETLIKYFAYYTDGTPVSSLPLEVTDLTFSFTGTNFTITTAKSAVESFKVLVVVDF